MLGLEEAWMTEHDHALTEIVEQHEGNRDDPLLRT